LSVAPRRSNAPFGAIVSIGVMLIGVLIAMGGKLADSKLVSFGGLSVMIISMFALVVTAYLYQGRSRGHRAMRNANPEAASQPDFLPAADTTSKLNPVPAVDLFPSVTEETTSRLQVSPDKKAVR